MVGNGRSFDSRLATGLVPVIQTVSLCLKSMVVQVKFSYYCIPFASIKTFFLEGSRTVNFSSSLPVHTTLLSIAANKSCTSETVLRVGGVPARRVLVLLLLCLTSCPYKWSFQVKSSLMLRLKVTSVLALGDRVPSLQYAIWPSYPACSETSSHPV